MYQLHAQSTLKEAKATKRAISIMYNKCHNMANCDVSLFRIRTKFTGNTLISFYYNDITTSRNLICHAQLQTSKQAVATKKAAKTTFGQ